ncbi:hypothetical protein [Serratia marcescens]|uniref:hypothetical protein n=2 Tax=Enterobacterales TaxID=91347 RepID=UPI00074509EE|nr:hypothetical protein [Serratia marcescens]MDU2603348.1 hypothetical protein [Serratia marcescens]MDU2744150.1 hypothetical protein [Serratia marcescens]PNU29596.1 hypothetical protein C2M05_24020 [Serratia marcescens]CAI1804335.1 Uncharacterised protein [Serratia marcescens]CUY08784.1 Uncharacterised protein [Serratia marcescens]
MDNKLSKPVMYVVRTLDGSVASVKSYSYTAPKGFTCEPLYSQEYVSALLSEIGEIERSLISNCVDYEFDLIKMKRRAEAAEQRYADLEERLKLVREQRDNELRSNAILEKRLATPVRLPLPYSPDPWMSPDPDGTWLDKEDVKKSIRAAGFVVELCSACNERYCGNCAHANGAKVQ